MITIKKLNGCTLYGAKNYPEMPVRLILCAPDKDNPKKTNVIAEGTSCEIYSKDGELIIKGIVDER